MIRMKRLLISGTRNVSTEVRVWKVINNLKFCKSSWRNIVFENLNDCLSWLFLKFPLFWRCACSADWSPTHHDSNCCFLELWTFQVRHRLPISNGSLRANLPAEKSMECVLQSHCAAKDLHTIQMWRQRHCRFHTCHEYCRSTLQKRFILDEVQKIVES